MGFVCIFMKVGFSICLITALAVSRVPGNLCSSLPVEQMIAEKRE